MIRENRYKAAIFDLDGTLLDTLEDITDSVNHILKKYGYPEKTLEEVRRSVGNGGRRLMELVVPSGEENPRFAQIHQEYEQYYKNHCQNKTRPYPGILKLLEQLHQAGIRTAIVSNKGDGAVKSLNDIYFKQYMDTSVGERPGIRKKPAPDTVLEAMAQLGTDRGDTIYIGDSEVDHATAVNAGIPCILVTWGFRRRSLLADLHPTHLVSAAGEILPILLPAGAFFCEA